MTTGIILQSLGENMGRTIEFIDFLFEGYTSNLIAEKDNKKKPRKKQKRLKKKVKKHKKKADGTTSSGRHPGSTQDIVSKEWYPQVDRTGCRVIISI